MSSVADAEALRSHGLRRASIPPWAFAGLALGGVALTLLLFAITPMQGVADLLVVAALVGTAVPCAVSWRIEGLRRAKDRLVTSLALLALVLTLIPLGFVIGYVIKRGAARFSTAFLTHSLAGIGPLDVGGGVYHAIIGTLEQVAIASAIAVPLGLMVAIYITEFGHNAFGTAVQFLIDVMTGIPSIVAGLFVLSFWIIALQQPQTGFAGGLALAIIELPIVVRTSEEMIRLVPGALREASYALGVPRWRTMLRVVLPTASTGITTGVMLAVARVIGETAPVLLVVGNNNFINFSPVSGAQGSLPVVVFLNAKSSSNSDVDRAWAAALTLILIVMILYVAARVLTRRNALAGGRP
jgi:phosphate transport system permease protein